MDWSRTLGVAARSSWHAWRYFAFIFADWLMQDTVASSRASAIAKMCPRPTHIEEE